MRLFSDNKIQFPVMWLCRAVAAGWGCKPLLKPAQAQLITPTPPCHSLVTQRCPFAGTAARKRVQREIPFALCFSWELILSTLSSALPRCPAGTENIQEQLWEGPRGAPAAQSSLQHRDAPWLQQKELKWQLREPWLVKWVYYFLSSG